jgi:hypothetical protein
MKTGLRTGFRFSFGLVMLVKMKLHSLLVKTFCLSFDDLDGILGTVSEAGP